MLVHGFLCHFDDQFVSHRNVGNIFFGFETFRRPTGRVDAKINSGNERGCLCLDESLGEL